MGYNFKHSQSADDCPNLTIVPKIVLKDRQGKMRVLADTLNTSEGSEWTVYRFAWTFVNDKALFKLALSGVV